MNFFKSYLFNTLDYIKISLLRFFFGTSYRIADTPPISVHKTLHIKHFFYRICYKIYSNHNILRDSSLLKKEDNLYVLSPMYICI